jgi:hypothetical protein
MTRSTYDLMYDRNGGKYVTGTTLQAGPYAAYKACTDTVIASLTCPKLTGTLTSITVKAGDFFPFPGNATDITLTSGTGVFINSYAQS